MKEAKLIIDGKEYSVQMKDEDVKAVTRPKTGYEFSNEDGKYYSVAISGVLELPSRLDDSDIELYNVGNYYTDKNLAEDIARADRLYCKLRQWQALNDDSVDCWNKDNLGYTIYYSYSDKKIEYCLINQCKSFGEIIFSSAETTEVAIKKFKDELTWYFTEFKQRLDERTIK